MQLKFPYIGFNYDYIQIQLKKNGMQIQP